MSFEYLIEEENNIKKLSQADENELVKKIDIEKQWTWDDEKLMEAYTCKKNMDEFRKNK